LGRSGVLSGQKREPMPPASTTAHSATPVSRSSIGSGCSTGSPTACPPPRRAPPIGRRASRPGRGARTRGGPTGPRRAGRRRAGNRTDGPDGRPDELPGGRRSGMRLRTRRARSARERRGATAPGERPRRAWHAWRPRGVGQGSYNRTPNDTLARRRSHLHVDASGFHRSSSCSLVASSRRRAGARPAAPRARGAWRGPPRSSGQRSPVCLPALVVAASLPARPALAQAESGGVVRGVVRAGAGGAGWPSPARGDG
jgi:hypothetical protein